MVRLAGCFRTLQAVPDFNMKPKLTEAGFKSAAEFLGVEVAAVKAVAEVESRGAGFLPDGRPTILFERHKFHKYTGGKFDQSHPDISNRKAGGYGRAGTHQWDRYGEAYDLDPLAAMKSCSWGKFQIMGFNHAEAGCASVQEFVDAMGQSEDEQLKAFVNFVKANGLTDELKRRDWAGFARGYNGADYKINKYDTKLAAAYRKHSKAISEIPETITKTADIDKGVTPGTKPANETEGTPPPTPAAEVKASQPSWTSRITSLGIPTGVLSGLGVIWKFAQGIPPWGWAVFGGIFVVALVVGAWLFNESMKRAQARTNTLMSAAADRDKNNLRLI